MAQMCAHTISGQRWRFECPSGSTFKDLKSDIQRSLHIAKRMQLLLVDGSRARPHEMLDRYATDDALGVTLVVAPAVCGFCEKSGAPLKRCSGCDERFEREPGQWVGSIYINLVLTLGVAVTGYLVLESLTSLTTSQQLNIWTTIAVTAPFVFYRISKGLWVSMIFLGEGLYIRWPHSTGQTDFNGRSSSQTQDRIARILKLPSVR